jgi:uncharacterized protein YndB with AHSA1/START domain
MSTTDRIEKKIELRASRARVFRALTDAREFGAWFKVELEGPFVPGQVVRGRISAPGYEHLTMELLVERIEPERYFAFKWHPYAIDPAVDYGAEPRTLVELTLEETKAGVLLTVTESGFDRIPLARRAEAFRMNEQGWAAQLENIERHASHA